MITYLIPGVSPAGTVIAVAGLTFLYGWYSGMETGLYRFNRLRSQLLAKTGDTTAKKLERVFTDQRLIIAVLLIGPNLFSYLATSVVTLYFARHGRSEHQAELFTMLTLTPIIFVFGETIPKAWFYATPNTLMRRSKTLILASYTFIKFSGLGFVLRTLTTATLKLAQVLAPTSPREHDDDPLATLLRESHAQGALSSVQTSIAERILQLADVRIRRIMIPIDRAVIADHSITRTQLIDTLRPHPVATVPLYDKHTRNITALVHTDVVLADPDREIRDLAEPILTLPAETSLLDALNTMHRRRARTALVTTPQRPLPISNQQSTISNSPPPHPVGLITLSDLVKYLLFT